jgi:hypothetical protein
VGSPAEEMAEVEQQIVKNMEAMQQQAATVSHASCGMHAA